MRPTPTTTIPPWPPATDAQSPLDCATALLSRLSDAELAQLAASALNAILVPTALEDVFVPAMDDHTHDAILDLGRVTRRRR